MHHPAWILIVSQSDKFRMTEVIDLRFILHLFLNWKSPRSSSIVARSDDIVCTVNKHLSGPFTFRHFGHDLIGMLFRNQLSYGASERLSHAVLNGFSGT
jgi:hypothetical protein